MKGQLGNYKDADGRIGHKSKGSQKRRRKGKVEEGKREREKKTALMSHSTELVK